jgi:hypothetical protein
VWLFGAFRLGRGCSSCHQRKSWFALLLRLVVVLFLYRASAVQLQVLGSANEAVCCQITSSNLDHLLLLLLCVCRAYVAQLQVLASCGEASWKDAIN